MYDIYFDFKLAYDFINREQIWIAYIKEFWVAQITSKFSCKLQFLLHYSYMQNMCLKKVGFKKYNVEKHYHKHTYQNHLLFKCI